MNYSIQLKTESPGYLQLYHYIRRDIINGVYPYQSKLPSKRTIAAETGVSVVTVDHALDILAEEGYIERKERSGSFVIYQETDFQAAPAKRTDGQPDTRKIQIGNPARKKSGIKIIEVKTEGEISHEVFPFTILSKTMRKVLLDYGNVILIKSPNQGLQQLREEISSYLARSRGIQVEPGQIVIGSGAEYLYGLIAQLFQEEPSIALESPAYEKIRQVYESMGWKCELLSMDQSGIRNLELEHSESRILHVTPFHSYPSGVTADISKKNAYLRWAAERGGYLIEDNYDSELTVSKKQEDALFSMAGGDRVIYINTFSKTIAPSLRVGYMILPKRLLGKFQEKLGFYSCTVPVFEQYVLAELLRSGDYERHINRVRRNRRREK